MLRSSWLIPLLLCATACATAKKPVASTSTESPRPSAVTAAERPSSPEALPPPADESPAPSALAALTSPTVYFGFDSTTLDPEAKAALDFFARLYEAGHEARVVTIEGHADERGTEEYNLVLSGRRADAVRRYLTRLGLAEPRLKVKAWGENRPDVRGSGEATWGRNRRAVIVPDSELSRR